MDSSQQAGTDDNTTSRVLLSLSIEGVFKVSILDSAPPAATVWFIKGQLSCSQSCTLLALCQWLSEILLTESDGVCDLDGSVTVGV